MRRTALLLAWTILAILVTGGAMLLGDEEPARAAVPGENGKIAFVSARGGDGDIFTMAPNGSGQTNLTLNPANRMGEHYPAWSPDGTKIAFRRDQPNADIFAMNADGSNPTRLTNRPSADHDPAWSPDGTKIAFAGFHDGTYSIFTIKPDGTGLTRLTNGTGDYEPTWSPDGTKIAFKSQRDGNSEIYAMNADGTEQRNLTNNSATQDGNPAWSPDGTKIAFGAYGAIYTMNADGSGQAPLTGTSEGASEPDWQPLPFTYNFNGFFSPVDNLPILNSTKAGNAVPVKFSLSGDQGISILAEGYPKSQRVTCDSTAPIDSIEQTITAGASNLSYDASIEQYTYIWKSDKGWSGTCRQFTMKLDDGSVHQANFKFK